MPAIQRRVQPLRKKATAEEENLNLFPTSRDAGDNGRLRNAIC
jgi:hypothetical protein